MVIAGQGYSKALDDLFMGQRQLRPEQGRLAEEGAAGSAVVGDVGRQDFMVKRAVAECRGRPFCCSLVGDGAFRNSNGKNPYLRNAAPIPGRGTRD